MMVTREWLQSWPRFLVVGRVEYHLQRLHHSPLLCPKPSLRNSQQPENANISTTLLRFLYAGDSQALVKQSITYSSTYFIKCYLANYNARQIIPPLKGECHHSFQTYRIVKLFVGYLSIHCDEQDRIFST